VDPVDFLLPAVDGAAGLLSDLPERPPGDPAELRAAGECWIDAGKALGDVIATARQRVAALDPSWTGAGKTAFVREWTGLAAAAGELGRELVTAGNRLVNAAGLLQAAQEKYDVVMASTAATTLAAAALAPFTFGGSLAAEAAEVAAGVAIAVGIAAEAAAVIADVVAAVVTIAEQLMARFVVLFGVNVATQGIVSMIVYPNHSPLHVDLRDAAGDAIGESVPGAQGIPVESLPARALVSGLLSGGLYAAGQEVATGHVDPVSALFAGARGAADPVADQAGEVLRGRPAG
jgi:uncharacterized protein YukE